MVSCFKEWMDDMMRQEDTTPVNSVIYDTFNLLSY
jgi:hypothetical protein